MEYNFLKIEHTNGITVMKISAPKTLNALNSSILKEISDFVDGVHFLQMLNFEIAEASRA